MQQSSKQILIFFPYNQRTVEQQSVMEMFVKKGHNVFKDQMHIMQKGFQANYFLNEKEIIIGDDVWIGFSRTILKGVMIGKGAIIGA